MSDPTFNEPNQSEYRVPPPPSFPEDIEPQEPVPVISEPASLASIFYEPARVFESFRAKPRFFLATLICMVLLVTFTSLYFKKVNYEKFMRAAIENSPRASQMSQQDIDKAVEMQSGPIAKTIGVYIGPPVAILISFVIGGLLYMLGAMIMGGKLTFTQGWAVWAYSSFPPFVLALLLNILLVFVKDPESYDIVAGSKGLVQANLGFLVSMKQSPILHTLLSSVDLFAFYGMFLAAMGLRIVGKISSGMAWTIVIALFALRVAASVLGASLFG